MADLDICLFCNKDRNDPKNLSTVCLGMRMTHGFTVGGPQTLAPKMVHRDPVNIVTCPQFPFDSGIPEAAREASPELIARVEEYIRQGGVTLASAMALVFSKEGVAKT